MHSRCWTANRRFRRGLQADNACIFCDQASETVDHILLGCVFSREVWAACLRLFLIDDMVLVMEENAMAWWTTSRKQLRKELRRGFDSLFLLVGWQLWKERNARMFNRVASSAAQLLQTVEQEITLWCAAGYKHLGTLDSQH